MDYNYARELQSSGSYNVNNELYVDGNGDMIHLYTYLSAALPGIKFCLNGNGAVLVITTDVTLSGAQETTMTNSIATYKAKTGPD